LICSPGQLDAGLIFVAVTGDSSSLGGKTDRAGAHGSCRGAVRPGRRGWPKFAV
jgi:hypothetical protein